MKKILPVFFVSSLLFATNTNAQLRDSSFNFSCTRDTTVDCSQTCIDLKGIIPDVHALSSDYTVNPVVSSDGSIGCYPSPGPLILGGPSANLVEDDVYTDAIPMSFDFPLYGITWTKMMISTNGEICFDENMAGERSNWVITGNLPSANYDRAVIMGPFHDIDIRQNTSPLRQIKYDYVGVKPHRKLILSFYKIPCFDCTDLINNSYQITLYEGLGIAEVFVAERQVCPTWNPTTGPGKAIIGIQNYARNRGIMAPGRTATGPAWGGLNMNETWRFTPKNGPSLFKKVELVDLNGNVVAAGDTSRGANNNLAVTFRNICPTATTKYIVRSVYYHYQYFEAPEFWPPLDKDSLIYGTDTVTIYKNGSIPQVDLTKTDGQCGTNPNGNITITTPTGTDYEYSIDGGNTYQASPSFSVPAGTYTVRVHDKTGTCIKDTTVTITTSSTLTGSAVSTNTSCPAASDGTITASGSLGGGSYEYAVDGGITPVFGALDYFTGLSAGNHTVFVKDALGCIYSFTHTINSDPVFTTTASSTNASCLGALNGAITVTQPSSGSPSFQYSIPGGIYNTPQPGASFTGLEGDSTYTIKVEDSKGCSYTFTQAVGYDAGVTGTAVPHSSSCSGVNNGYIELTASNGTAPYFYQVDTGSAPPVFVNLDDIRNLGAGSYNVTIKDNAGCMYNLTNISVTSGTGVRAVARTENTACNAASTGKISLSIDLLTGTAPFYYSLNNGAYQLFAYPTVDTIKNLPAGNYSVSIKDGVGCTYGLPPITILANNPGVAATFTTKPTACATATTGQVAIKTTTGISPFSYNLDNSGLVLLPDTIRNLDSGFHSILIQDALGCNITINPEITIGPGVAATFTTKPTACATATTGQVHIVPTSGVAPFSYNLDNTGLVPLTDTIRNLDSGFHAILVQDVLGCNATINPEITIGSGVIATFITKPTACATATTGQVYITPTSGVGPFSYNADNTGLLPLTDTIRNLDSGFHSILVQDVLGCNTTINPEVTIGPGVSATFTTKPTACAVATTGQIAITPTAGLAPFRYNLDNAGLVALTDTLRNLDSGFHSILVQDALGCNVTITPEVAIGAGVTATFTTKVTACATASTGQIFITPTTAGAAPFRYNLDNNGLVPLTDTLRNLDSGFHSILVQDALGCNVTINPEVGFGVGVTATSRTFNTACLGVSTGQIVVTPTTGTPPFKYALGSASSQPLDTIRNLASDNYTVILMDAVGCSANVPATVGYNAGVTASFTPINSACAAAATGAIIVKPLTGKGAFIYSIDGGATSQSDSVFRNLAADAYTIRVTDALGCFVNSPVQNVGNNPGVLYSPSTIQNASCESIPNGSITVNVTAGIAPFSYAITSPIAGSPQPGNQFTALSSGAYDIAITDSAGCTNLVNAVVGNNPKVKFDSLSIVRPTCNSLQNGTIAVNVSLGVSPYEFAIDRQPYSNSKSFSSIGAGAHFIQVKDANNCAIDTTIIITEPALLTTAVLSTTKATCSGNPDGKIMMDAVGGTPPYQYTLDGAGLNGYQSGTSFDALKGSYTVTAMDAMGCKATANATVDSVFTMYLDLGNETTICADASVVLSPTTNPETSIFTYSPAGSLDKDNIKNPTASPTDTTTYTLTAQWGICTLTDNVKVNVLRKPVPNAGSDVVICFDTTTVLSASASNLSGTVNFVWSPANLLDTKADTTVVTARPVEENTYYKVTVTDNYNCNFSVTDSVLVKMLPQVYAFAGNDTNAVLNTPHQLTATGAGIGGSYVWSYPSGVTLSDDRTATPIATFIPVPEPGTYVNPDTNFYRLSVIATDAAGCSAADTIKINVFIGPVTYVPSAFSPNNDGLNDKFEPVPVGVNIEYFRVFNRYGEVVYETSRFRNGWDGTHKGKPQPAGAYVWIFKGKDRKGREILNKGTVMLVR